MSASTPDAKKSSFKIYLSGNEFNSDKDGNMQETSQTQAETIVDPQVASEHPPPSLHDIIQSKLSVGRELICNIQQQPTSTKRRMHKVPESLRKMNPDSYEPKVVSIGPYHYGNPRLAEIELLKPMALTSYIEAYRVQDFSTIISKFSDELIEELIGYYYDDDEWKKQFRSYNEFASMLITDTAFVIIFIRFFNYKFGPFRISIEQATFVKPDLFLLENQIPIKVIRILLPDFWGLTVLSDFFGVSRDEETMNIFRKSDHLLDFYNGILGSHPIGSTERYRFLCCLFRVFNNFSISCWTPNQPIFSSLEPHELRLSHSTAKELSKMGICFKLNKTPNLHGIKFNINYIGAEFKLPKITFDHTTEIRWMNIIAHEMCKVPENQSEEEEAKNPSVASYICLLDSLIDNAEDVQELRSAGVLDNFFGSDEQVANLINELARQYTMNPLHFRDVKQKMSMYKGISWKLKPGIWLADVKRDYFQSPWSLIAVLVTSFVILLTIAQTYFTIYPRS